MKFVGVAQKVNIFGKQKKREGKNDYIYGIYFIIFSVILEIVNFITLGIGVLPTHFGLELSIILMLAGFVFMLPSKWLKIAFSTIFIIFQGVINIINSCVYKNLSNITTVDMLFARGGETASVFELDFINWGCLIVSLCILAVYITAIVLGNKFAPKLKSIYKYSSLAITILIALVVEGVGFVSFDSINQSYATDSQSEYLYENGEYLYGSNDLKLANMKNYGFYAYYLKSLERFVNYQEKLLPSEQEELEKFINDGNGYSYNNSIYLGDKVSSVMKGDNLIMIMMESMEWFGIDEFNTPNLYNLIYNDSMYFTEYYSRNSTNFSEDISILGNVPNEYSFSNILNRVGVCTPESLPNYFKNAGYESINFFHDYLGDFYDRYTLNTALGFDKVYALEDSSLPDKSDKFGDFVDDGDYVESLIDTMIPKDKSFFSFFTTVSTHGPYTQSNYRFEKYYQIFDKNYELFSNYVKKNNLGYILPETVGGNNKDYLALREFKSKAMALDHAIEVILNYLDNTTDANGNKLKDKTTIVLFADHNTYYQDLSYKMHGVDQYAYEKTAYRVPFVISSSKLSSGENSTFCNTYDIFPTICDLFGFTFNSNLTQGYSVFSNDISKSMFLSSLSGVFDKNVYSLDMIDFYKDNQKVEIDQDVLDFKEKVNSYIKKQIMIEKYYRVNYAKNY